jgi:serine protease Do
MKRLVLLSPLVLISVVISYIQIIYANVPDIVLKQKKAVVTIYIDDKDGNRIATGSGFIIDPNGIIVTNYHVAKVWLEANNTITLKMENGAFYPVEDFISFNEDNDIAPLKAAGKELPTVNLAKDYKSKQGESVVVIGSPLGLETTVSDGIVSSVRGKDGLIQITAPVSPGSGGSPVFNSRGKVIGVATFLIDGGQNLNFAIPIKHVSYLLKTHETIKKKSIVDDLGVIKLA